MPGDVVRSLVANKNLPKNGQYQISPSKLASLNANVEQEDRIRPVCATD
ncbi:MAG: hypothetical protein PUD02_00675 [Eggerthellales bacterium]|nr:hypothetical protein [Eggerthellales bacterium]